MPVSRRRFLDLLLAGEFLALAGLILHPILRYLMPGSAEEATPARVLVCPDSELASNAFKIVRFGPRPVLVMRSSEGKVLAFSAACTHLQCTVQYRPDLKQIWCACHDGRYDVTGRNVGGPPPRPLDRFNVEVQGGDLYVVKA